MLFYKMTLRYLLVHELLNYPLSRIDFFTHWSMINFAGNKMRVSLIDHISGSTTEDSIYTSMEALNNSSLELHQQQQRHSQQPSHHWQPSNRNRVKVLPDLALNNEPAKLSRTNPNVMFKRPSSMSSLMY